MWTNVIAVAGIIALCGFIGLLIYARFYDCDPLSANVIMATTDLDCYRNKANGFIYS